MEKGSQAREAAKLARGSWLLWQTKSGKGTAAQSAREFAQHVQCLLQTVCKEDAHLAPS